MKRLLITAALFATSANADPINVLRCHDGAQYSNPNAFVFEDEAAGIYTTCVITGQTVERELSATALADINAVTTGAYCSPYVFIYALGQWYAIHTGC